MATPKRVSKLLDELAAAEQEFLRREFLAPVVRGGEVRVRIAGVVCRLRIEPADFEGWGVFQPVSHRRARLARTASLAQRREYLELLPLVRLILCRREADRWLAIPAHGADTRFRIEGLIPVHLVEEAQLFEVIRGRFDGAHCWFESVEARHDPGNAAYLRGALREMTDPDRLRRPGLSAEERTAYGLNYWPRRKAQIEAEQDRTEARLREALAHAGAEMLDYLERRDSYRVSYVVDGRQHVSSVEKGDLTVQTAGICLEGRDRNFDLQSLVGVLREGQAEGEIHRT